MTTVKQVGRQVGRQPTSRKKGHEEGVGGSRGRIAIEIDGPTNAALIKVIEQTGTLVTKRDYVKEALIQRLPDSRSDMLCYECHIKNGDVDFICQACHEIYYTDPCESDVYLCPLF
jgi:hypothetical protein